MDQAKLIEKTDIKSLLPEEIMALTALAGEPTYRVKQIFSWLSKGVTSFDEMKNLPGELRKKLHDTCFLNSLKLSKKQLSPKDGTIKYLWELSDNSAVETVLMSYRHGNTVCISTQVGCRMGCLFCASTIGGLKRNLEPSEILDQVLFSENESGLRVSNVVLMGIGEPLDNFDNVIKFLRLINHADGRAVGMRHISISTCGLIEKFDKLGDLNLQLTLSISLHAPDDETRTKLMPINSQNGVAELMRACRKYFDKTKRRVSFEYTLIDGINDSPRHAKLLAKRALELGAHINIITLNEVPGRGIKPSKPQTLREFMKILEENGARATLRRKLGGDVSASCGQLRASRGID